MRWALLGGITLLLAACTTGGGPTSPTVVPSSVSVSSAAGPTVLSPSTTGSALPGNFLTTSPKLRQRLSDIPSSHLNASLPPAPESLDRSSRVPLPSHRYSYSPTPGSRCTPSDGSDCAWGCADAQRYWDAYGNHAFSFTCTGCYSCRPQGETCPDHCSNSACGAWCVLVNEPCPVAYRNEASNSQTWRAWFWARDRYAAGLDPYGRSC